MVADIARGYRGDLRPIEAYDMLLSENAVLVDTRGSEVTVQLPGGANKRVLVCGIEKSGAFSNAAAGKVAALKIASLRGVSRGKKVILLDQNGGSAKALAKEAEKRGQQAAKIQSKVDEAMTEILTYVTLNKLNADDEKSLRNRLKDIDKH